MMFKKLFLFIILLNCFLINPEVLILENEEIIDGKIIKMDEDTITVITKNKEIVIDRDKIIQTFRSIDDYNKSLKTEKKEVIEKGKLIAEWLFNGNDNDTSGNELHGIYLGPKLLTEDRFGKKDSAYEFGIGKTYAIRVRNINISILLQQIFSISVWIKIKEHYSNSKIIDFYNQEDKIGYSIFYDSKSNKIFDAWLNNGTNKNIETKTNLNKEVWFHIVITYDKNKARLYLNGELENDGLIQKNNIIYVKSNEALFFIGRSVSESPHSYQFSGSIDDIRLYDYALTEEEVKKHYYENGWPK